MSVNTKERAAVSEILTEVGVPQNLIGYKYIVDSVCLCLDDSEYLHKVTNGIYPKVAEMNNTTKTAVERSIRIAIQKVFTFGDSKLVRKYFGGSFYSKDSKYVTNSHFIACFVRYVNLYGVDSILKSFGREGLINE